MNFSRLATAAGITMAAGVAALALAGPALAYPSGTAPTATISSTVVAPGGAVTVTVSHVTPGTTLTLTISSVPQTLATGAVAKGSTTASITGTIPATLSGVHTLTAATSADGVVGSFSITIAASGSGSTSSSGGGSLASTGAAVTGIGILGAALVLGGVFFVVAGRKRANAASSTQAS